MDLQSGVRIVESHCSGCANILDARERGNSSIMRVATASELHTDRLRSENLESRHYRTGMKTISPLYTQAAIQHRHNAIVQLKTLMR